MAASGQGSPTLLHHWRGSEQPEMWAVTDSLALTDIGLGL